MLEDVRLFVLIMICAYSSATLTQIDAKKSLLDHIKNDVGAHVAGANTEGEYRTMYCILLSLYKLYIFTDEPDLHWLPGNKTSLLLASPLVSVQASCVYFGKIEW